MSDNLRFVATCPSGLAPFLEKELVGFGAVITEKSLASLSFSGSLEVAYRVCLWSRFASRVLYPLAGFSAENKEQLYAAAYAIDWGAHFSVHQTFAVTAVIDGDPAEGISHSKFAALVVKDAVADWFRQQVGARPFVAPSHPQLPLYLYIQKKQAVLGIDLSGDALHKRGYRSATGEAPLKENLAAAMAVASGISAGVAPDVVMDPLCGSGTLLIEALLLYADVAPALGRSYFGFLGWKQHNRLLWAQLLSEAKQRKETALANKANWPKFIGFDAHQQMVRLARNHFEAMGFADCIQVERKELCFIQNPLTQGSGVMLTNPPYGERLGEKSALKYFYQYLGDQLKRSFQNWQVAVISSDVTLLDGMRLQSKENYRVFNGGLPCLLRVYDIPAREDESRDFSLSVENIEAEVGADLKNRLVKNYKQLEKWLKKERITCFRLYDADLPDYNFALDVYAGRFHLQEYQAPKTVDAAKAQKRLEVAEDIITRLFHLRKNQLFLKKRQKQKGAAQYQKHEDQKQFFQVGEGRARFLVNLTDYLDTGLFLDHRPLRLLFSEQMQGKRFLNLFAYTGAVSVQAALGGAESTTTVDLSPAYSEWARANLALNGLSETNHDVIEADCVSWLQEAKQSFDVIFLDPPTFSNSKRTETVLDIQRDHVGLIHLAMKRLSSGGELYFSNNFRRFILDREALNEYVIEDVTKKTIPLDFKRDDKIHQCYKITVKST